jgi:UDP-N-acetylglucosamine:LPS N-acetylglucosamine transferase
VFLSYPTKKIKHNYELVGNPVFLNALELKKHIYKVKNKILFTSGTLGAKAINQFVINISNTPFLDNYDIYVVTGKKYYEDVVKKVNKPNYHIYSFWCYWNHIWRYTCS